MKKRTVKLELEVSLPTDDRHCDGCPALGERYCNHLKETLRCEELTGKTDRLLAHRSPRCPFSPSKCFVCKKVLEPKQVGDEYILEHKCEGMFLTELIAKGATADDAITNFNQYIVYIGRAFRQR